MELTGKCKKDFEKWYADTYYGEQRKTIQNLHRVVFDCLPDNKKYGVYEDFFDSVEIRIEIVFINKVWKTYVDGNPLLEPKKHKSSRLNARIVAINKANKTHNGKI